MVPWLQRSLTSVQGVHVWPYDPKIRQDRKCLDALCFFEAYVPSSFTNCYTLDSRNCTQYTTVYC